MTCIHRTTLALSLLCLLSSGFDAGTRSRSCASTTDSPKDFLTISDTIKAGDEPMAEVKVRAEPGGYTAVTDDRGRYSIKVPYGWSGRLVPEIAGGPDSLGSFTNVTTDIIDGRPVPSSGRPPMVPSGTPAYPRAVLPGPAGNVFVIPTAAVVPQMVSETAEDLRIMLQIFRDKLSEPRLVRGAFVDFGDFFGDRGRTLEAFYLQGSAAVFVLEMDAPFSFAPPQPSGEQAASEDVDPVWQRARQKIYSPPDLTRRGRPGTTERMDFQQFKEDLLQTLRHAANLRHVEPNEAVILTIIARDESAVWAAPAGAGGTYGGAQGMWFEGSSYSTSSSSFGPGGGTTYADSATRSSGSAADRGRLGRRPPGSAAATVLTIQLKKADIDAFAQGDLSFEQFQQRVKMFMY
jgi:hypothetical protein